MKFNNGDEIFTKKLIRSNAKQVGLLSKPGTISTRITLTLPRLVTQMRVETVEWTGVVPSIARNVKWKRKEMREGRG